MLTALCKGSLLSLSAIALLGVVTLLLSIFEIILLQSFPLFMSFKNPLKTEKNLPYQNIGRDNELFNKAKKMIGVFDMLQFSL